MNLRTRKIHQKNEFEYGYGEQYLQSSHKILQDTGHYPVIDNQRDYWNQFEAAYRSPLPDNNSKQNNSNGNTEEFPFVIKTPF